MPIFKKIIGSLKIEERKKMSDVFTVIAIISVVSLLISNVVANKSVELFGWTVAGQKLSIASSFIVFPITYISSDIFFRSLRIRMEQKNKLDCAFFQYFHDTLF